MTDEDKAKHLAARRARCHEAFDPQRKPRATCSVLTERGETGFGSGDSGEWAFVDALADLDRQIEKRVRIETRAAELAALYSKI